MQSLSTIPIVIDTSGDSQKNSGVGFTMFSMAEQYAMAMGQIEHPPLTLVSSNINEQELKK